MEMAISFKIQGYRVFKSTKSGYYYITIKRGVERSLQTKNGDIAKDRSRSVVKTLLEKKITLLKKNKNKTISEYLEDYINDREDLSIKTTKLDKTAISFFIDIVGDLPISEIRDSHIKKFRQVYTYWKTPRGKLISKASVNSYLRHLKSFFKQAKEDKLIIDMPKIKMIKEGLKIPRILTPEEKTALLDYTFKEDYNFHRIINFALFTGCRRYEIKTALWENFNNGLLKVTGKGNKERNVPIIKEALFFMGPPKTSGPIFWQVHPDTYTHFFKTYARDCNIKGVKFHTLRHSAATTMIEKGIPIEIIQKILGHSQISTTQIYAQVLDEKMMEEMKKLSNR
jgi:integrase